MQQGAAPAQAPLDLLAEHLLADGERFSADADEDRWDSAIDSAARAADAEADEYQKAQLAADARGDTRTGTIETHCVLACRRVAASIRVLSNARATAAPTPEYVSGWLACQKEAADDAAEAHHELMAPSRLSSEFFARRIRALAPPSAPPATCEAHVWEAFPASTVECGNVLPCKTHPSAPSVQQFEDRLLLLKALLGADAQRTGPDELIIYTGERSPPPQFRLTLDAEGFPILTAELRSALTKATHG